MQSYCNTQRLVQQRSSQDLDKLLTYQNLAYYFHFKHSVIDESTVLAQSHTCCGAPYILLVENATSFNMQYLLVQDFRAQQTLSNVQERLLLRARDYDLV